MKKYTSLSLKIVAVLLLSGCLDELGFNQCSDDVVEDFQELTMACADGPDFDCQSTADLFNERHPDVSCEAEIENPLGGQIETLEIDPFLVNQVRFGSDFFR